MPDISMCNTEGCPQAAKCYRKTAKPDYLQSYMSFLLNADWSCDHFMEQPKPMRICKKCGIRWEKDCDAFGCWSCGGSYIVEGTR